MRSENRRCSRQITAQIAVRVLEISGHRRALRQPFLQRGVQVVAGEQAETVLERRDGFRPGLVEGCGRERDAGEKGAQPLRLGETARGIPGQRVGIAVLAVGPRADLIYGWPDGERGPQRAGSGVLVEFEECRARHAGARQMRDEPVIGEYGRRIAHRAVVALDEYVAVIGAHHRPGRGRPPAMGQHLLRAHRLGERREHAARLVEGHVGPSLRDDVQLRVVVGVLHDEVLSLGGPHRADRRRSVARAARDGGGAQADLRLRSPVLAESRSTVGIVPSQLA